jgi:hypothetical protein
MNRYAPGGDLYEALAEKYGRVAADRVWQASESGDSGAIAEAIAQAQNYYAPRDTSTGSIFVEQVTTDPFAAPLGSLNTGLGTVLGSALKGLFKNPWVLLAVVVVLALYFWPLLRPLVGRVLKRP